MKWWSKFLILPPPGVPRSLKHTLRESPRAGDASAHVPWAQDEEIHQRLYELLNEQVRHEKQPLAHLQLTRRLLRRPLRPCSALSLLQLNCVLSPPVAEDARQRAAGDSGGGGGSNDGGWR